MRRRAFLHLLLLLALPPVCARADDPRQVLLNSLSADVSFWGDQTTTVSHPEGGKQVTTHQRVYRKGTILRMEYPGGRTLFDDGASAVLYFPHPNTFERRGTSFDPELIAREKRQVMAKRLVVEQLADGEVAGRPAWVIQIRLPNGTSRQFWIDKQTNVQLRRDEVRLGGVTASTYFTQIHFTEPPADKLTFTLPAGAQQVEPGQGRPLGQTRAQEVARAWNGPRLPRWLPPGYRFRAFYPHAYGRQQGLVAVYDGPKPGESLSVFQGPVVGMEGMSVRHGRKLRALGARRGAADVMVVGPLPQADLQRVMESIPQ